MGTGIWVVVPVRVIANEYLEIFVNSQFLYAILEASMWSYLRCIGTQCFILKKILMGII